VASALQIVILDEIFNDVGYLLTWSQRIDGDPLIRLRQSLLQNLIRDACSLAVMRCDASEIVLEPTEFVWVVNEIFEAYADIAGRKCGIAAVRERSHELM